MLTLNQKRQAHINELAIKLNCRLVQQANMPGMMFVEFGYIEGPIIENQIHYLTMLHELGHQFNGHTQGRPPHSDKTHYFDNGVLKSEAEAWDYCLNNCDEEIEDASRTFMWDYCLGSYYRHAVLYGDKPCKLLNGDRGYVEFIWDKPDDFFIGVVNRITGNDMFLKKA